MNEQETTIIQIAIQREVWEQFKISCKKNRLDRKSQAEFILLEEIKKFNEENR